MHLTYPNFDPHTRGALHPLGFKTGALADRIDVTDAMIDAGLTAFARSCPDYGGWCADTAAEIVEEIIASALAAYADKSARAG